MSEDMKTGKLDTTDTTEKILKDQLTVMRQQLRLTRILAAAASVTAVVILAAALMILPFAVRSLRQADQVLSGLQEADLPEMVENIKNLTKGSQEEINKTVDKLNQLDVESLNKAIQNLENATRPLAGLFGS